MTSKAFNKATQASKNLNATLFIQGGERYSINKGITIDIDEELLKITTDNRVEFIELSSIYRISILGI